MGHRQTKLTAIPQRVKDEVWNRDGGRCIICGNPYAAPNAHVIPRSKGGLGVPENIVTLCADCHRKYDQSPLRWDYREKIEEYLNAIYPDWDEKRLTFRRFM